MNKILATLLALMLAVAAGAQSYTIKGTVAEKSNGKLIVGANIMVKGLTVGAATNVNGEFTIKVPKAGDYTLVATYTGMQRLAQRVSVRGDVSDLAFRMEESVGAIDEVVVTGTGTHHSLKTAPVQTEVFSNKTIAKLAPRSFEEMATSISPSFDFTPGTMGSFLRVNGLGNDFVVLMVNGKRVYGDVGGQTDLNRISPDNIERVEVVKGASSALYGSDAIGAVINVITKKSKSTVSFDNTTRFGAYGDFQQANTLDLNIGKLSSNTQFARKQIDGYQLSPFEIDAKSKVLSLTEAKAVNRFYDNTVSQRLSYGITSNLDVYAQGSWYEKDYFRPKSVADFGFYYKDVSGAAGVKYKINGKSTITFDAATDNFWYYYHYNKDVVDSKTKKLLFSDGQKTLNTKQVRNEYNLKSVTAIGDKNLLTAGLDYVNENIDSPARFKGGSADAYTAGVYLQDEYTPIKSLSIVAGARFVDHKAFGSRLTPKISALYSLGDFNLRASYGSGFKAPTLKELYFEYFKTGTLYLGNENLKPQSSDFYSASVEYNKKGVSLSVTGYRNELRNLIDYGPEQIPTPEQAAQGAKKVKVHQNISEARSQGVDFLANAYVGYGFTVGGGYSLVEAKNLTSNTTLEGAAKHYGTVMASYRYSYKRYVLNASINGRLQDEKFYAKGNARGYNIWKFTTTHTFKVCAGVTIDAIAGIDNIFDYVDDAPYGMPYGTLSPGRTVFGGLNFKISK
ncbi:TonB-dependent receptor [Alistipes sp. ZOR0009]|uniref:TonB-dependent receptor n=1 Tax=Alistipes sp. ZOR0009 TaxID=1339253 RepID=UPI000646B4CD|nr:TonB-dependent receptor [Alistipes sp. ZOR0009]